MVGFGCSTGPAEFNHTDFDPPPYDASHVASDGMDRSILVRDTLEHLSSFVTDSLFRPEDRTGPIEFFEPSDMDVSFTGKVALLDRGSSVVSVHDSEAAEQPGRMVPAMGRGN